jgi:Fe-S oxidoreductase/nitrate reductase gamma subunit
MLALLAALIFAAGVYCRISVWQKGYWTRVEFSLADLVKNGLLLGRLWRQDLLAALLHCLVLWGFLILFLGTCLLSFHEWVLPFLKGRVYLAFALTMDLAGLAFLLGAAGLLSRRILLSSFRLPSDWQDWGLLILLLLVGLSGFLAEAARLAVVRPPWAWSQPAGSWLADLLWPQTPPGSTVLAWVWWGHALMSLALVALLPWFKLWHALAAPLNLALNQADAYVSAEDWEEKGTEFFFKNLLSADACAQCNRCEMVCPSHQAGEGLSPRVFTRVFASYARHQNSPLGRFLFWGSAEPKWKNKEIHLKAEEAFYCTTCGACKEVCPVMNSPLDLLFNLRVNIVEQGAKVPGPVSKALGSLAKYKNPWGATRKKKAAWVKDLDLVDLAKKKQSVDWLLFAGCTTSLDATAMPMARAMAGIMHQAGLATGVLGKKEPCCGDLARRLGENGLFEMLAEEALELMAARGVKKVLAMSPHCAYTMTREYPSLIGELEIEAKSLPEVWHYSQLLDSLIERRLLSFKALTGKIATYHDPCYLGRHRGIFDPPRRVLKELGLTIREMADHHQDSLCCGAGGGRMWNAEVEGALTHISHLRAAQARETGADYLVTACPLCLIMLTDAVKAMNLEEEIRVVDLACLANEALAG